MLKITEIYFNGESITDLQRMLEIIKSETKYTIIAVDKVGQTNLLGSTDYRGETFKIGNSTITIN